MRLMLMGMSRTFVGLVSAALMLLGAVVFIYALDSVLEERAIAMQPVDADKPLTRTNEAAF